MQGKEFIYPEVYRPVIDTSTEMGKRISDTFDSLENYKSLVKEFIFTNILLAFDEGDERVNLARVQHILSSALLRSLYLRNGMVEAINSGNMVSLFANLKSFIEIPAFLAHLYSLLDKNKSESELLDELVKIAMGNRGSSKLRVGYTEITNVKTMFEKLDKLINKWAQESGNTNPKASSDKIMSSFYDVVCNASHPNYDAHDVIGTFDVEKQLWRGFESQEVKKRILSEFNWYSPPLNVAISVIEHLSRSIMKHPKIKSFEKLNNPLYFSVKI